MLITSRRQRWPSSLGVPAQSLDVLARAASVALLRDLAPRLTPAEADDLAEELGDFPLALQLAGSYLAQFGRINVTAYLAKLRGDVILAHADAARILKALADMRHATEDYAGALPLYQRVLAWNEHTLGPTHPETVQLLTHLGSVSFWTKEYAVARVLYERALAMMEQTRGPVHPATAVRIMDLAAVLQELGETSRARELYERAIVIREQTLGLSHRETIESVSSLASLLNTMGAYAEARPHYERLRNHVIQTYRPGYPGIQILDVILRRIDERVQSATKDAP